MMVFTSHARRGEAPVLVREGFSWGAFLFGFLYLVANRAWIPAAINLAGAILVRWMAAGVHSGAPMLGLAVLQGLFARDLLRWSLRRRGFVAGPVVAAGGREAAFARLLDARADLLPAGYGTGG